MHISAYKSGARIYDVIWRKFTRKTLDRILQILGFYPLPNESVEKRSLRLLDLACGTGELEIRLVRLFPQIKLTALDNSPQMLLEATNKLSGWVGEQVSFVQSDLTFPLPFAEATFDYIVFANALHYVARPGDLLDEIRKVLKPGGQIIIEDFTVNGHFLWNWFEKVLRLVDSQHYRTYTFSELNRFLTEAGFIKSTGECFKISWWWRGMLVSAIRATEGLS